MTQKAREATNLVRAVLELAVIHLPGPVGERTRRRYWARRLNGLGRGVIIDVGVQFVNPEHITLEDNCWIDKYAILMAGPPGEGERTIVRRGNPDFPASEGDLVVSRNCHVGAQSVVNAHGGVWIGPNTSIGPGAKLISLSHHYCNPDDPEDRFPYRFGSQVPAHEQLLISGPIVLAENSALGANSIMMPGTVIGANGWVGAAALVSRSVPGDMLSVGVPARPVKAR